MFNWRKSACKVLDRGEPICLVQITKTKGSTPRDTGTIMVVSADKAYGTIGGGNLEMAAIDTARQCLSGQKSHPQTLSYILGPDVEQCCGGRVELKFQIINTRSECPDLPSPSLSPLYVFGAGHVGQALAYALAPLPFSLHLFDNRDQYIRGQVLSYGDPAKTVQTAPANTAFLIMTHDHSLDYELCRAVLSRDDYSFLGLIGSKTKRARFLSRLKQDGFTGAQRARLTCPIGLMTIKGKEPEIIAASVAAQLLQVLGKNNGN